MSRTRNAFWGDIRTPEEGSWLHRHSLQLFLIFMTTWQTIAALVLYYLVWLYGWDKNSGEVAAWAFLVFFGAIYFTSLVADSYGAWLQVFATKHFIEPGSPQSKDA